MFDYVDQIEYPGLDQYLDNELMFLYSDLLDYTDFQILSVVDYVNMSIADTLDYTDFLIGLTDQAVQNNAVGIGLVNDALNDNVQMLLSNIRASENQLREEINQAQVILQNQIWHIESELSDYFRMPVNSLNAFVQATASIVEAYDSALQGHLLTIVNQGQLQVNTIYFDAMSNIANALKELSKALGYPPAFIINTVENFHSSDIGLMANEGLSLETSENVWFDLLIEFLLMLSGQANDFVDNEAKFLAVARAKLSVPIVLRNIEYSKKLKAEQVRQAEAITLNEDNITAIFAWVDKYTEWLPGELIRVCESYFTPLAQKVDDFIYNTFNAFVDEVAEAFIVIEEFIGKVETRVDLTDERLEYPANYLSEIYDLDPEERARQLALLDKLASEEFNDRAEDIDEETAENIRDKENQQLEDDKDYKSKRPVNVSQVSVYSNKEKQSQFAQTIFVEEV